MFSPRKNVLVSFLKKPHLESFSSKEGRVREAVRERVLRVLLRRSCSPSCGLRQGRFSQTDWLGSAGEVDEHRIANSISGCAPEMPWPPTAC